MKAFKGGVTAVVRAVMVVPLLGVAACGGYTPDFNLLSRGPSPEFNGATLVAAADNQDQVVNQIGRMAGIDPKQGPNGQLYWRPDGPAQWKQFGIAALGRGRLECNAYITEIMKVEEHRRTTNQQLGLAGAATAGILGVAGAASMAIAITAIAFGLAQGTVDNVTTGLLYSLGAEPVQALVGNMRAAYIEKLTDDSWLDRSTTFNTIYGYLELCTPVVLREKIKVAVATVPVQATAGDKQGGTPRVSLATQRIIETRIIRDASAPLPAAVPTQYAPGARDGERVSTVYVAELQRTLCVAPASGTLGPATRLALKQFQSGRGRAAAAPDSFGDDIKQGEMMKNLEEAMDEARGFQRCVDRGFLRNAFEVGFWGGLPKAQRAAEFKRYLAKMRKALGSNEVLFPADDTELEKATRAAIDLVRPAAVLNVPGPAGEFDFALIKKLQALPD